MNVASHRPAGPTPYTPVATSYAGLITRAVAFAADVAIVQGILFTIGVVATLIIEAFGQANLEGNVETILAATGVWTLALAGYLVAFWSLTGQTPGMRGLGIEVTTCDGERMPARRSVLRFVGLLLAALPLFAGYFLILLRDDRRGLHDLLARSAVRYAERKRPPRPFRGRRP